MCSYILMSSEQFYCSVLAGGMTKLFYRSHESLVVLNPVEENSEKDSKSMTYMYNQLLSVTVKNMAKINKNPRLMFTDRVTQFIFF